MPLILGYWDLRGLVQPTKLLLEYTGLKYEDKIYPLISAPEVGEKAWADDKFNLGLSFPNLPYLIDGDVKITQSSAVIRHVARKSDLCGKTEAEKSQVDCLDSELVDLRTRFSNLCYNADFEKLRPEYVKNLEGKMKEFSECLGSRDWFVGNSITYVDFMAYEYIEVNRILEPTCLRAFKNLESFLSRVEKLPQISAYMKSSRFIKSPLNGSSAFFGGSR